MIICDDMHMQSNRAIRDKRTDMPQPMTPSTLPVISTPMKRFFSICRPGSRIGVRDLARERKHQGDLHVRCGDGIAERRIHHDDAPCGRRRDIDIVDANAARPMTRSFAAFQESWL